MESNDQNVVGHDRELAEIAAVVKSKPGGWAVAGIMAAVIAVPVAILVVWLPREFDRINGQLETLSAQSEGIEGIVADANSNSRTLLESMDAFVEAVAKNDAMLTGGGQYARAQILSLLPSDLRASANMIVAVESARYGNLRGPITIYFESSGFSGLTALEQQNVFRALEARGVNFVILDGPFPPTLEERVLSSGSVQDELMREWMRRSGIGTNVGGSSNISSGIILPESAEGAE